MNEHSARVPRDHWLLDWEEEAIAAFFVKHPREGGRRLAFMMLAADVVAESCARGRAAFRDGQEYRPGVGAARDPRGVVVCTPRGL